MALLIMLCASPGIPGSKTENEAFFFFSDPVLKKNAKWPGEKPKKNILTIQLNQF